MIQLPNAAISHRGAEVRSLLRPIAKARGGPAFEIRSQSDLLVVGTHDGGRPTSDVASWRFALFLPRHQGSYFEVWRALDAEQTAWYLTKAYLTIYRVSRTAETEVLALHCDPEEPEGELARYKRGPHVHVSVAEHPVPKAHIALAVGHLDQVLVSPASLTGAMDTSIKMIRNEVLRRLLPDHLLTEHPVM